MRKRLRCTLLQLIGAAAPAQGWSGSARGGGGAPTLEALAAPAGGVSGWAGWASKWKGRSGRGLAVWRRWSVGQVGLERRGGGRGGAGRGWGSIRRLQPENGQVNHAFVAAAPFPSSRRLHFLYIRLHSRIPERR